MPKKRNAENRGLPARWQHKHNAFYYRVPPGQEGRWDGKTTYRLGSTISDAHREWAKRVEQLDNARTLAQLIDRYSLEHLTTLAVKTRESYSPALSRIRTVFGEVDCTDIEAHHVNIYFDRIKRKHSLATARGDIAVFRGLFSQALRWGAVKVHPMIGLRFEQVAPASDEVHQWQIDAMLGIPADTRAVQLAQHYIRLKLMLGLRRGDMLRLRLSDFKSDGLRCKLRKTEKTSEVKLFIPWVNPKTGREFTEFKTLVESIKAIKPKRGTDGFLFCAQDGAGYVDEDTGRADGFDSLWRRFMAKVISQTDIDKRIKEKTLRAFVADESGTLEAAAHRLGHTSTTTTERHYRKRARVVLPLVDSGKTKHPVNESMGQS